MSWPRTTVSKYTQQFLSAALICVGLISNSLADEPTVLARFGQWTLVASGDARQLLDTSGLVAVTCSNSFRLYLALLKITDKSAVRRDEQIKADYFYFTAWADRGEPKDYRFYVAEQPAQYAQVTIPLNPAAPSNSNSEFWQQFKTAQERFSYSTARGTVTEDMKDFAPALFRFEEECAKVLPPPYQNGDVR